MTLPELIARLPAFNRAAGFPVRAFHLEGLLQAIERIEADIAVHHTIDKLSKYCGLNRRQLKTLFKLATGRSVFQYLLHLRMQKGEQLVRTTDDPINEIALTCGYLTANSFSEQFKRRFDMNPLAYRKQLQYIA